MTYRILVSGSKVIDRTTEQAVFDAIDATVERTDATDASGLVDVVPGVDALVVDAGTQVTAPVLAAADSLAVVGRSGIGVDNVDVASAVDHGVTVVHVPAYCVDEVATHALALLLACERKLLPFDRSVRDGDWDWSVAAPIHRLSGSTVGLVAFGKIARNLARKLSGFELDVVACDPYVAAAEMAAFDVTRVSFEELLDRSDFVSVHAPLTDETERLFDDAAFRSMRDGAVFVNTARGGVVDEAALATALRTGPVAAAGLDVRQSEPPADSPLDDLENVVLTPHAGWYSEEAREELNHTVAEDVVRVLTGDEPHHPVDPGADW